jgi:uncharacterized protein
MADRIPELLRADAFAHPARDIRLVETHISWVILAGEFAYKLRKPVNFGFLDFTTLVQRRADCEAEIDLNRRLCPDVYLDVVDVVEGEEDGKLCIGGKGRAVEPAVMMRRLPEAGMLPRLVERSDADRRLMERIASALSAFHASARTGSGVDEYGSIATIRENWAENFRQTHTELLNPLKAEAIRLYVDRFLGERRDLLDRRLRMGRIREGHGDLHAASVCATRRAVYLFDCIEFNPRFRCADVVADVAFLAMDLEHLGRADLSEAFVGTYVRQSGDAELLSLLDFYKCYRAFVRGKVLAFRLADSRLDPTSRAKIAAEVRAYFDLAYAVAEPPAKPLLIVSMGLPASGKSTLARGLAGRLGAIHLSSDFTRKHLVGLRPNVHRIDAFEGGIYTRTMSRRTYASMRKQATRWLRRGRSVVLDATFGQPAERAALRHLARRLGVRTYFIVCRADEATLKDRLAARMTEPDATSDARLEIWPALRAGFVEPTETPIDFCADTTLSNDVLVERILGDLRVRPELKREVRMMNATSHVGAVGVGMAGNCMRQRSTSACSVLRQA